MPFVNIMILAGRSKEQKQRLAKTVTEAVAASIDVDPAKVWIQIDEVDGDHFAIGGQLVADKS